jgi:glucose-6-phosphate 1-dehydrogenase
LEKPFGRDLDSAVSLNRLLARVTGDAREQAVFRVDHVLGMATGQNLLSLRLFNRMFEPIWNSVHIEQIDLLWDEDLELEGRAGYFDTSGTLRDVVQNHLIQVLCLIAMEPPTALDERHIRDRKVELLRSVRRLSDEQVVSHTRRARYTEGRLVQSAGGEAVPAYVDEKGVHS